MKQAPNSYPVVHNSGFLTMIQIRKITLQLCKCSSYVNITQLY